MKLSNPKISWQESGHPYSTDYDDIYFSASDPIGESEHVFINGNRLRRRLKDFQDKRFTIGEIGFGSGLNFLLTWKLWQEIDTKQTALHYIAFEKHPLHPKQHLALCNLWPELSELSERLVSQLPARCSGCHRLFLENNVILDLHFGDALARMTKLDCRTGINAWYLDGFSPANNQELWQPDLLKEIARLSQNDCTLASYSVAGQFRRGLEAAGFTTEKNPGFGSKRQMLSAIYQSDKKSSDLATGKPWNKLPLSSGSAMPGNIAIIGAGLAGSSLAFSLSRRGLSATVFDSGENLATGASGISQFALRPRLFQSHSVLAEFYLQSYLFAVRQLAFLQESGNLSWHATGVLQLEDALNKKTSLDLERLAELYPDSVVKHLTGEEKVSYLAHSSENILDFPQGGWLSPQSLCKSLIELSNAELKLNTSVSKLIPNDPKWILVCENGEEYEFCKVIIANSYGLSNFEQTASLPLEITAGQVSKFSVEGPTAAIEKVICGARTIFPTISEKENAHLVAASYRNDSSLSNSSADDNENYELARTLLNDGWQMSKNSQASQVAMRTNTSDKVPLVGQVPNLEVINENFRELSQNAKKIFEETDNAENYHSGLYISAAHGSNGLATCGFSAEIIASLICNEQLPVNSSMLDALNPVRFAIRTLKKQLD